MKFASFLLLVVLSGPTAMVPARTRVRQYGFPRLAPGQLWVSSVPVGLEVRAGENPVVKKVLGRTPLVVRASDAGRFVTITIQKKEYNGELPTQMDLVDFSAKTTHSGSIRRGNVDEDVSRGMTYEVPLPPKQTVIALFQARSSPLSRIERLYPPGNNFKFSDEAARNTFAKKGIPPAFAGIGIRLLHRGGKVSLPGRDGWLIAEVTPAGRVDVLELPTKPSR